MLAMCCFAYQIASALQRRARRLVSMNGYIIEHTPLRVKTLSRVQGWSLSID